MRCLSLLTFLLGLAHLEAAHLRHQPRKLVESVPFAVRLQVRVAESDKVTPPTSADYDGAINAVETWFRTSSEAYYSGNNPSFVGTTCQLQESFTTHNPYCEPGGYPYIIAMNCEATFDGADIPSSLDLVSKANANYPMDGFLQAYLVPLAPAGSPLKSANSIKLTLYGKTLGTVTSPDPDRAVAPDSTVGSDVVVVPLPAGAEVVSSTTPAPTPKLPEGLEIVSVTSSYPNSNAATAGVESTTGIIEVIMEWTMSVADTAVDRQPTRAEYNVFLAQSKAFINDVFSASFNANKTPELAPFNNVNSYFKSTTYTPSEEHPHKIVIQSNTFFDMSRTTKVPAMWQWVRALRDAGISTFRVDYLGAVDAGLFNDLKFIQWQALD